MKNQEDFSISLRSLQSDIRFEVILAELLTENLDIENVQIECASLFKRSYHYDIERIGKIEYGTNKIKKLLFVLNREGIYDLLPEDLFHQVSEFINAEDKEEAIKEIQEQNNLEENIRLFFQPIEQEFFNQRIKLEIEERKFLFETNHILPGEIFNYLWNLPEFLDDLQKSKLGLLMPVLDKITGRNALVSFIIESITGDPVEISEAAPMKCQLYDYPVLGSAQLEIDCVLGGEMNGLQRGFTIIIFLSDAERITDYMPGGKKAMIHEYLCDMLMPFDSEIIFELNLSKTVASFFIKEDEPCSGRLNYTTIL